MAGGAMATASSDGPKEKAELWPTKAANASAGKYLNSFIRFTPKKADQTRSTVGAGLPAMAAVSSTSLSQASQLLQLIVFQFKFLIVCQPKVKA
jgi:hypothetical protein